MSSVEPKQLDYFFKGIFALLGFSCSVIFYSIWSDVQSLTKITNSLDGRLIKIETKIDDELAARSRDDARRDKAIEELQRTVSLKLAKPQ